MTTPEFGAPTSFDDADRAASIPPQKLHNSKMVVLGAKKLKTEKEVRVILPEEKYLDGLQKIIVRDYFPELPKLKAQKEYLDAVAANDLTKIRELQLRYSTKRTIRRTSPTTESSTPALFDPSTPTPSTSDAHFKSTRNEGKISEKKKKPEEILTVDSYVNKFTSEDNASFEELALLHKKKEQIRNEWMYEAEKKHNRELVTRGPELIKAADEQLIKAISGAAEEKPKDLDNWTYKARSIVHFHPDEAPLTLEEHLQRQKANQRVINKSATRFPTEICKEKAQSTATKAALHQAAINPGKVDITGREVGIPHAVIHDLVATPSPVPGVDESPFMTWGEIEGTPFRLDASDMVTSNLAPSFKIPEVPVREKIAQGIAETIAKRYHDKRKIAIRQVERHHSKTPNFGSARSSEKLLLMSPAARRLATHGLGIRLSSDKELKASYTPSPIKTPRSTRFTRTPGSSQILRKTVKKSAGHIGTPAAVADTTNSSLTDNLLSFGDSDAVKKCRPSASDFF